MPGSGTYFGQVGHFWWVFFDPSEARKREEIDQNDELWPNVEVIPR